MSANVPGATGHFCRAPEYGMKSAPAEANKNKADKHKVYLTGPFDRDWLPTSSEKGDGAFLVSRAAVGIVATV